MMRSVHMFRELYATNCILLLIFILQNFDRNSLKQFSLIFLLNFATVGSEQHVVRKI